MTSDQGQTITLDITPTLYRFDELKGAAVTKAREEYRHYMASSHQKSPHLKSLPAAVLDSIIRYNDAQFLSNGTLVPE